MLRVLAVSRLPASERLVWATCSLYGTVLRRDRPLREACQGLACTLHETRRLYTDPITAGALGRIKGAVRAEHEHIESLARGTYCNTE